MRNVRSVGLLVMLVVGGCAAVERSAPSPAAKTKVSTLLTEPLAADAGREGRLLTVDIPPGASTPAHRHDGAVFVYVAEGAVISAIDDGPERRFAAGEAWHERLGQVHRVSRNASATEPARLVIFFLTEPGAPVLRMEK